MMQSKKVRKKRTPNWRILLVTAVPALLIYALIAMLNCGPATVFGGSADLRGVDFSSKPLVVLDGEWEFYWNKLLSPQAFRSGGARAMDSYMKVPGVWSTDAGTDYSRQGMSTYRMTLRYPTMLQDPALRIQHVANAYQLFVNGQQAAEVGGGLGSKSDSIDDDKILLVALPRGADSVELVFQVANWNLAAGGLRAAPVFGSLQVLEQQRLLLLVLQMFFIGGAFIFGIQYLFIYFLQTKNKTALFFAIFCLLTTLRSLVWGETPLAVLIPQASPQLRIYLNYLTGYNFVAVIILLVQCIYPPRHGRVITGLVLLPSLVFDVLLLIMGLHSMSFLTSILYVILQLQMVYLLGVQISAVLRRKEDAVLIFVTVCVLIWAMNADILNFQRIGSIYLTCMFLLGNFIFILAMSYIQARQQAANHKTLTVYNEKLLEADKLKDKIMATELSFLQAQIKPHFLYNALSTIANVCEKNGEQAGKLILDLAVYLRGSLGFNNLDQTATIEKELEFVDTYFRIEQARFGQKIQLHKEIEIPLHARMPVLMLQPLVENAVRHGISKKPGGGRVTVRMKACEEGIEIEIENDGLGIPGEKLAGILEQSDAAQGVGLRNIHSRLLKLYGKGLELRSGAGHTCVKLWIPEKVWP